MRLSVIIPIYNKEVSILKCIESICKQEYKEIEIILVDDGSSDRSVEVAQTYLQMTAIKYHLIQQKNRGPAAARNRGLEIASGDYIMFVDADDYLLPESISKLIAISERYCADVVECGYSSGSSQQKKSNEIYEISGFKDCVRDLLTQKRIKPVVWASVYKKNAIKGVRFDETMHLGEDTCFKISCLKNNIKVVSTEDIFYVNVTDDNKTLSRKKLDKKDVESVVAYMQFAEKEISCFQDLHSELYVYLYKVAVSYYARMIREDNIIEDEIYKSLYDLIIYYEKKIRNIPIAYFLEMKLIKKNKKMFRFVYKLLKEKRQ